MKTLALPVIAAVAVLSATVFPLTSIADTSPQLTRYNTQTVGDVEVFYREAGAADAPVLLLLHGFPSSSHQYRELIPLLADKYRVIAPDYPGFGSTVAPPRGEYEYSFDNLAKTIGGFTEALKLDSYAMYVFDYGAPIGFRLAVKNPERISAIISQNGNAYEEGLSDAWGPIKALWADSSEGNRDALRGLLKVETTQWQYTTGAPEDRQHLISPDSIAHDQAILDRDAEIQLDLFESYATNVAAYPKWQAYLKENQPPVLALWGQNDPFFPPAGAEAFKRDVPNAIVEYVDAGHFPLETHLPEIATRIRTFLSAL